MVSSAGTTSRLVLVSVLPGVSRAANQTEPLQLAVCLLANVAYISWFGTGCTEAGWQVKMWDVDAEKSRAAFFKPASSERSTFILSAVSVSC